MTVSGRTRIRVVGYEPLSDEQREIRELVRTLARERIAPRAAEIDASGEFPWDVVELLREHEILGLPFEERFGGTGTGTLMVLVAIEEISRACATTGLILGHAGAGRARDQERRDGGAEGALPPAPGERRVAPGVRADRARLRLRRGRDALRGRERDGDEYVLNGSKRFITNAGVAGVYVVFAKTDPDGGPRGDLGVHRRGGRSRLRGRPHRAEDGDQGLDHR